MIFRFRRFFSFFLIFLLPAWSALAYEHIVSFRPNVTEILFALGLGPKVVGVTEFCNYPPEAQKIAKIGGYANRSLEKILSLKPDLAVLVPDATTPKLESALDRSGIEVLVVKADSLEDVDASIRTIASKTGVVARGDALIASIHKGMETAVGKQVRQPKPKALMVIQRRPLVVAGSGTFLSSLMDKAGVDNIAGASTLPYPRFSIEAVIARAPDVIFDLDAAEPGDYWSRYTSLPAVKNGKVVRLPPDLFVPGPRIPEALKALVTAAKTATE